MEEGTNKGKTSNYSSHTIIHERTFQKLYLQGLKLWYESEKRKKLTEVEIFIDG